MTYCDYKTYIAYGGTLTEADFTLLSARSSRLIDQETLGRAAAYADILKSELQIACCMTIDLLIRRDAALDNAKGGMVSSANNDGYSESYVNSSASNSALRQELHGILVQALGADPYGLLYRGI